MKGLDEPRRKNRPPDVFLILLFKSTRLSKATKKDTNYKLVSHSGANEVVIYNFWALITIDKNINQFTKVYHIFYKLQYKYIKKLHD